jgi:hypothetical protein
MVEHMPRWVFPMTLAASASLMELALWVVFAQTSALAAPRQL